jgi:hypothetical protein
MLSESAADAIAQLDFQFDGHRITSTAKVAAL